MNPGFMEPAPGQGAERRVHAFKVKRMMEWLNREGERDDGILGCKSTD